MYHYMKYDSAKNTYIIGPADEIKYIDKTKVSDEVKPFKQNIWVCKTKEPLEEYSKKHAEDQIKKYMKTIERIKQRTITIKKKRYNYV